jgi:SAM-dependent methyltransferase
VTLPLFSPEFNLTPRFHNRRKAGNIQSGMPALRTAIAKARWSLHHRGLIGSLRQVASRLNKVRSKASQPAIHPFDALHSVDTGGLITAPHLSPGHPHALEATAYCATPPSRFAALLDIWANSPPERAINEYTFIDIGCGKGRTLLMAAALPFREVLGVELDPNLACIAEENLARSRDAGLALPPTRILCTDAADFDLPESPCLIYLYNPFTAVILERLLDRLEASLAHRPRPLDILYCNSLHAGVIAARPGFRALWSGVANLEKEDAEAEPCAAGDEISALFRYAP